MSTFPTVMGINAHNFSTTIRTGSPRGDIFFVGQASRIFSRNDAGGHRYYTITNNHDHGGNKLPQRGFRGDIPITYRG